MRNIFTELSQLPPLSSDQDAFMVYAAHQFEDGRANSAPQLKIAARPDAYATIKEWLLEDDKVVDFYLRPLTPADYNAIRRQRAMNSLVSTVFSYALLRSDSEG